LLGEPHAANKITIPERSSQQDCEIGEDTEHELSLSRQDDSDLSVISDAEEMELNDDFANAAREEIKMAHADGDVEEDKEGEMSDSESLEPSEELDDLSEYDEDDVKLEEHNKLTQLLEQKTQKPVPVANPSKLKLPYEMLINKLVDSLHTPAMIKNKELPRPNELAHVSEPTEPAQKLFVQSYPTMMTQATET
jgi:hypothetical protein